MYIDTMCDVDVVRPNLFSPIIISEDDENSHNLICQLMINDENLQIPTSGYTVKLHYKRADGTQGSVTGTVSSGKFFVEIPEALIELDDFVYCDICLTYQKSITKHTMSVVNDEIITSSVTKTVDVALRSGLFKIDSQYRVII